MTAHRDPTTRGVRVAVIGGGIAGLAAAHQLLTSAPDLDVTVLEGSPAVGGKLVRGEVGGVAVDLGAESILNRRPEGVELARIVGLGGDIVHPVTASAAVWTRGRVVSLPPTVMGVPADLRSAARSGVLSRRGVVRARAERLLPRVTLEGDVAIGRLVAGRLGPEVRDRLVEPLLGGVYAGHADELSAAATVPQLLSAVRTHGRLLAAAQAATAESQRASDGPPVFAGIAGGVARLAERTADEVARLGGTVRTGAMVRGLARQGSGWRLVIGPARAPEAFDADAVVLATPAAPTARLLDQVVPAAATELRQVEYASMAIVTLALPAANIPADLTGSGFLVPPIDRRVVKASTFSSLKWGWLSGEVFLLRASIGRHREEQVLQRDDAELVSSAMADLEEAVGLRGQLLDARVTRWGGALPQYAVGHLDRVARIQAILGDVPGLEVCGAAYAGVGIPAVIASARSAATRVLGLLESTETMGP
jgi:oxygen-dependent protoporphyrinogen oxidase